MFNYYNFFPSLLLHSFHFNSKRVQVKEMSASYQQDTEKTGTGHFFSILHELNSRKNGFTCYLYKNIFSFRISSLNLFFLYKMMTWMCSLFFLKQNLFFWNFIYAKWSLLGNFTQEKKRRRRDICKIKMIHHKSRHNGFGTEYSNRFELMIFFHQPGGQYSILSKCLQMSQREWFNDCVG